MVVTATEPPPLQADLLFLIEATAANGASFLDLKTNYIIPTLEYFHGGTLEEGGGNGSVYGIITYKTADCHPGDPVSTFGPFTCPLKLIEAIDKIQFIGGKGETRACVTEALTTALSCLEEIGRNEVPKHALLLCCSPPYSAYAGGFAPAGCPATIEQAGRLVGERGVQLSVISPRKHPALMSLYEHASGDLHAAQQKNYAKDPRHMVLLRGYSLKERPPSPAPPPVPEIQTDMYGGRVVAGAGRGAFPRVGSVPGPGGPGGPGGQGGPGPQGTQAMPGPRAAANSWLAPPRHPIYTNNSALLTQLAQPSFPPPPQSQASHSGLQRLPGMMQGAPPAAPPLSAPQTPQPQQPSTQQVAPPQRTYIWSGVLEWMEKGKAPGDQQKVTKHLPCQVSANSKDIEPELKVETWPNKLLMQLMPKQLISNIGGQYLKDSKSVLFHLQHNEALDALTKVMVNGFAGCVHFSPMSSPPQCDIRVLILLYTPDKNAYLGFIPNNQATFVERLRKVIQHQKITQIINKQTSPANQLGAPQMPNTSMPNMPGQSPMGSQGMPSGSGMQPSSAMGSSATMGSAQGMGNAPGMGSTQGMGNAPGMASSNLGPNAMGNPPGLGPSGGMPAGAGMGNPQGMGGGSSMGNVGQMQSVGQMQGGSQSMMQQQQSMHHQQQVQQQQGMLMGGGGNQAVGSGGRVSQLDGLEAARQHNLEKIHQLQQTLELDGVEAARQHNLEKIHRLQQTLEAAHQQEAQFKSQMDIMSHLHAAQQQEQHYKQLEEQQRKHHLQQQLQAQVRAAGPRPHTLPPPRALRPSNPGLRHLLQQQPQYRPGGGQPRPQTQQYEDVPNYSDFL